MPRQRCGEIMPPLAIGPLTRAKNALNEPLTLPVENRPDSVNINNVITNADEHGLRASFSRVIAQVLTRALRLEDVIP